MLKMWASGAATCLIVYCLLVWLFGLFRSEHEASGLWWIQVIIMGLLFPSYMVALIRYLERRALRHAPRRSEAGKSTEIRDLQGRLIHTFPEGDLREADLTKAALRRACLWGEHLERADLREADLSAGMLRAAVVRGADLRGARLCGADLIGADLRQADLRGADLRGAQLGGAELGGAVYDEETRWPLGFRPEKRGCVRPDGAHPNLPVPAEARDIAAATLPRPVEAPTRSEVVDSTTRLLGR